MSAEPLPTAILLSVAGLLLALSAVFSRASGRVGLPTALLFLAVGIAAGSEGVGGIDFEDYGFAFRLGTVALTLILFDGGLNTPLSSIRDGIKPAAVLATLGVVGTAALVALGAWLLGLSPAEAALLGAVVSSTDAAAVFSVLRQSGVHLRRRVGMTLELESGLNDPMAVILTLSLTAALISGRPPGLELVGQLVVQLLVGGLVGAGLGHAGRWLLRWAKLPAGGLYPVLTIALALVAFGLPTLLLGSGFLAVYVAGVILGNGPLPFRAGILRVHDAVAWFSQVSVFLVLGLLVFPSRLVSVAVEGLALAALLAFVARPVVVAACLAPFGFAWRESLYIGWVGLRGAVPVVLATFPVLSGAPGAERIFDLVFFVVVVNTLLQGSTVKWLTQRLGLEVAVKPTPPALLEVDSAGNLTGEVVHFYVDPASAASGSQIVDLPFPDGSSVMTVVRGNELLAPKGGTKLEPGDHVYVITRAEDRAFVELLFGHAES